jgi:hypothetical protein
MDERVAGEAGVVHHAADRPDAGFDIRDRRGDVVELRDVERPAQRITRIERHVDAHDAPAAGFERGGDRGTDAARSAGHEGDIGTCGHVCFPW